MGVFASLKVYNYRVWAMGALFGNVGTWMQRVAQDWIVLTVLTNDDGLWVGVITALQFGPSLLFSPVGGLMADRLNRRRVLMITQSLQALIAGALGCLFLADQVNLLVMCVFATIGGCIAGIEAPFFQTLPGQLVGYKLLPNAVALNSAMFNAARMIGPAVAGLALAAWSAGWVFIVNAASFGATVGALAAMRPAEFKPMASVERAKGQLRSALRYIGKRGDIKVIMLVIGVVSCLGLNSQLTMGVMAKVAFDRGAGQYGILGSLMAAGSLAGALMAARRVRPRVRTVLAGAFGFGVTSTISALAPNYTFYAISLIFVGLFTLTFITAANAVLQLSVEPSMRGRVASVYMVVFLGCTPIGSPLVGWVADNFGPRWSIGIGAIAALVVSAGAALWTRKRWSVTVRLDGLMPPHLVVVNRAAGESEAPHNAGPAAEADSAPNDGPEADPASNDGPDPDPGADPDRPN